MLAWALKTGFSVSVTTTSKVLVWVLPCASVTVQITGVVPTGKREPEAGTQVTGPMPGQLSVAVGAVKVTTAPHTPASLFAAMFACALNTGFSLSVTTTSKVLVCVFPCASVTVQTTAVVPTGNREPEAGTQGRAPKPGQLSVAVGAVKVITAPH